MPGAGCTDPLLYPIPSSSASSTGVPQVEQIAERQASQMSAADSSLAQAGQ
jgi:hypothetical protein